MAFRGWYRNTSNHFQPQAGNFQPATKEIRRTLLAFSRRLEAIPETHPLVRSATRKIFESHRSRFEMTLPKQDKKISSLSKSLLDPFLKLKTFSRWWLEAFRSRAAIDEWRHLSEIFVVYFLCLKPYNADGVRVSISDG